MNKSAEQNGDGEKKIFPGSRAESIEQTAHSGFPAEYKVSLPIERSIINMLYNRVLEEESVKWDTIAEIADSFNQLGDDMERFANNFLFQKDLENPYRKEAPQKIAQHMQNLVERIDKTHAVLDENREILGDVITGLLRNALNVLQERAGQVRNAAIKENPVTLKKYYKSFESYRNKFFSELSQVLSTLTNDPFARASAGPFDKEMAENILNALKVPAIPEGMLAEYIKKDKEGNLDLSNFEKDYKLYMAIELPQHQAEIEEEINAKRAELEKEEKQWEQRVDSPAIKEDIKEVLMKEYGYWQQMTPEKRYKQLLRLRAFELLKLSAGEKRLTPEFMYKLYSEMKFVD